MGKDMVLTKAGLPAECRLCPSESRKTRQANLVRDWPHVRQGIVPADWAGEPDENLEVGE
jgi:hypothetical protein